MAEGILLNKINGAKKDLSNVTTVSSTGQTILEQAGLVSKLAAQSKLKEKSSAWLNNSTVQITQTRGEKPAANYSEITSDKIYNLISKQSDLTTDYYIVEKVSSTNYLSGPFIYNSKEDYYINSAQMSSGASCYSIAKVTIKLSKATAISVKYYHNTSNYMNANYGIVGKIDTSLADSNTADSTYAVSTQRTGTTEQSSTYSFGTLSAGTHYFYVKYIHTSRYAAGEDRFGFRVIGVTRKDNTTIPTKVTLKGATSVSLTNINTAFSTEIFSNAVTKTSYYIPSLNLFYYYGTSGNSDSRYLNIQGLSTDIVSGTNYEAWQLN